MEDQCERHEPGPHMKGGCTGCSESWKSVSVYRGWTRYDVRSNVCPARIDMDQVQTANGRI